MICAEVTTANSGLGTVQVLSPMNPQPTDYTTCTYVIQSGAELNSGLMPLSINEASQLIQPILLLLSIGFVFRALSYTLKTSTDTTEHS